jgi:hypothetical protein
MLEVFYSRLDVWLSSDEFNKLVKEEYRQKELLNDFLTKFTLDFIKQMTIDDYILGKKNHSSFCYCVEYSLEGYGATGGRTTAPQKYGIHWDKEHKKYSFGGKKVKNSKFGFEPEIIFQNVRNSLISLIEDTSSKNYDGIVNNILNPQFKNKVSYLYSSDSQLPIYSKDDLNLILSALDIPFSLSSDRFFKRLKLYDFYVKNGINEKMSPLMFMNFIYSNYGYRKLLRSTEKLSADKKAFEMAQNLEIIDITLISKHEDSDGPAKESSNRKGSKYNPDSEEKKRITGKKAEQLVIDYLNTHKNELKIYGEIVAWCNDDDSKGYDISYKQTDGKDIYIEVKGVSQDINDRIMFEISSNQIKVMKKNPENYYIFFINNVEKATNIKRILAKNISLDNFEPVKFKVNTKYGTQIHL